MLNVNKQQKVVLRLIALVAALTIILPSIVKAQEYTDLVVTLEVEQGQLAEITADGCWKYDGGTSNWKWSGPGDTTLKLLQPGTRKDTGTGDPADGEDADWGTVTGTAKYNTAGGTPNGTTFGPTNTNAFAYGDCKFTITFMGYSNYAIELYGTPFEHTVVLAEINDMRNYNQTNFDYILDSEASGYPYVEGQGEHGFYIVAENIEKVELDTGAAAEVTYDSPQKAYNALTCNTDRPCYHFIPVNNPPTQSPQVLYTETAGDIEEKTLIIRAGASADFSFPAGDYAMTLTVNLKILP